MSEKIKRLKRELKYKGAIVDFYQDTMEIDGTHTATWDFISHKGAAAVVPVTEDGKILMVRQYRNALERYTLEVPAGALDAADEPGIVCAGRELEEETGFRSENLEWLITLRTTVAFCNERIEVFVARDPDSLILRFAAFFYSWLYHGVLLWFKTDTDTCRFTVDRADCQDLICFLPVPLRDTKRTSCGHFHRSCGNCIRRTVFYLLFCQRTSKEPI